MKARRSLTSTVVPIALLGVVVVAWHFMSGTVVPAWALSSPGAVLRSAVRFVTSGDLWPNLQVTGLAVLIGYPLGIVVGVLSGYLLGRYRWLGESLEPIMVGMRGIPVVALAPIAIIWFGIGLRAEVMIVIYVSSFFTFFNTYASVRYLDQDLISYAQLLGANVSSIPFRVILPAVSPSIMTAVRISGPLAVTGAVVAEFIAARAGLGYYVRESAELLNMTNVFVGVVYLVLLVVVINTSTRMIEDRLLRWVPKREEGGAPVQ